MSAPAPLPPLLFIRPPVQRQDFRRSVQETLGEALAKNVKLCAQATKEDVIKNLFEDASPLLKGCFTRLFDSNADEACFDDNNPAVILKTIYFGLFLAVSRYHSIDAYSCHFLSLADWYIMACSSASTDFGAVARDPLALIWFNQWRIMEVLPEMPSELSLASIFRGGADFAPIFKGNVSPMTLVKRLRLRIGLKPGFEFPRPELIFAEVLKTSIDAAKDSKMTSLWTNLTKSRKPIDWVNSLMQSRGACSINLNKWLSKRKEDQDVLDQVRLPSLFTGGKLSPNSIALSEASYFIFWHIQTRAYRIIGLDRRDEAETIKISSVWNEAKKAATPPTAPLPPLPPTPSPAPSEKKEEKAEKKEPKQPKEPKEPKAAKPAVTSRPPSLSPPPPIKTTSFAPTFEEHSSQAGSDGPEGGVGDSDDFYSKPEPKPPAKLEPRKRTLLKKSRPPSSSESESSDDEEAFSRTTKKKKSKKRPRKGSASEEENSDGGEDADFDLRRKPGQGRTNVDPESQSLNSDESRELDSDEVEEMEAIEQTEEREGFASGLIAPDEFDRDELDIFDQLNEEDRMHVIYSDDRCKAIKRLAKKRGLKPFGSDEERPPKRSADNGDAEEPSAKRHKSSAAATKGSSEPKLPFASAAELYYTSLAPGYVAQNGVLYSAFVALLNVAALAPSSAEFDAAWVVLRKAIDDYTELAGRGKSLRDPGNPVNPPNFGGSRKDARLIALLNVLLKKANQKSSGGVLAVADPGCPNLRSKFLASLATFCGKLAADDASTNSGVLIEIERQEEIWRTTTSSHQLLQYMLDDEVIYNTARILMGGCVTQGNTYWVLQTKTREWESQKDD